MSGGSPVLKDLISELKNCLAENWHYSFLLSTNRHVWNVGSWLKINKNFIEKGDLVSSYSHVDFAKDMLRSEESYPEVDNNKEIMCNYEEKDTLVTNSIIRESESWPIRIKECSLKDGKIVVKLDRASVFKTILISLHSKGLEYGNQERRGEVISTSTDFIPEDSDLSQLRLALISKVLNRVLEKIGYTISTGPDCAECCLKLHLTLNPAIKLSNVSTLVCGVVRNCSDLKKEVNISAEIYRRMRERDMEQASVHKYGSLVHQPPWEKFIAALSDAAVTVDLLSTKLSQPISLDLQDKFTLSREKSNKGATFLLYNYARLISILKQFDEKVRQGVYPPLAPIESTDFSLLSSEEEWVLLYCYVMPYPSLLVQVVRPDQPMFNIHVLIQFMQDLCKCLSAYYSRVHILTEPRKHLLPLMYSRLHLISGIKVLMQSIFALLNIIPVSQM